MYINHHSPRQVFANSTMQVLGTDNAKQIVLTDDQSLQEKAQFEDCTLDFIAFILADMPGIKDVFV